jgi:predicted secreted protein
MGYIEVELMQEAVVFDGEGNKRRLRQMIGTQKDTSLTSMVRITLLEDIPSRFHSLFAPFPEEALVPMEQIIV